MQLIDRTTHGLKSTARRLIRKFGFQVRRIRPHDLSERLVFSRIPGWFSQAEAELLYLLAFMSRGRVLEIGHFVGRSTSALCQGIRDSGRSVEFNSYDIGYSNEDEYRAFYTKLYNDPEWSDYPREVFHQWAYSKETPVTELARANLALHGLNNYVNLYKGDFSELDRTRYDLIFCDATHDEHEIKHNLPKIVDVSDDLCTWAFHDMNAANMETVLALAPVEFITSADSLGVFQYRAERR